MGLFFDPLIFPNLFSPEVGYLSYKSEILFGGPKCESACIENIQDFDC